ncbi:hypothetical protein HOA91_05940 [Candidatus Woesearchaeota archaeon]|jgi:hypothetical protein|nr:hypothetical protein [Candidatus Woesearchaeota archaeon]
MDLNYIRAGIFFIGGIVSIVFSKQISKMQKYFSKKLKVNYADGEKSMKIIGIMFLIISLGLFLYAYLY